MNWQPIETAPKDAIFQGWFRDSDFEDDPEHEGYWEPECCFNSNGDLETFVDDCWVVIAPNIRLVAWMPLPEPPK